MSTQITEEDKKRAVEVLITAANIAQERGAFNFQEATTIYGAISYLSEKTEEETEEETSEETEEETFEETTNENTQKEDEK